MQTTTNSIILIGYFRSFKDNTQNIETHEFFELHLDEQNSFSIGLPLVNLHVF